MRRLYYWTANFCQKSFQTVVMKYRTQQFRCSIQSLLAVERFFCCGFIPWRHHYKETASARHYHNLTYSYRRNGRRRARCNSACSNEMDLASNIRYNPKKINGWTREHQSFNWNMYSTCKHTMSKLMWPEKPHKIRKMWINLTQLFNSVWNTSEEKHSCEENTTRVECTTLANSC